MTVFLFRLFVCLSCLFVCVGEGEIGGSKSQLTYAFPQVTLTVDMFLKLKVLISNEVDIYDLSKKNMYILEAEGNVGNSNWKLE